jgi:polyisoprenyl-phosphate glycosyltransferase
MTERLPLLSIVSPAFNEQEVLPPFHAELIRVLETLEDEYRIEILYVDDGSADATPAVLAGLSARDPRVRYLLLSRNFGHQAALTAGLEHARGDLVISMDSDLQHPPALIPELLAHWKLGNDIVLTIREDHRSLSPFKRLTSRLFYMMMRTMSGMDIRPAASDFRLMTRKSLNALLAMPERHRFLRGMVHWLGFPRQEVPFQAPPRFAGKSKYTLLKMVRLARDGLLSFSRVPLHAALLTAGGTLILSFLLSSASWLLWHPEGSVRWLLLALIVTLHMGGMSIWVALLAFSEYLARVHEQVLGRPLYLIRDTSDSAAENQQNGIRNYSRESSAA